ncbi:RNA polymerase sigma-70 factor, ECF subfamily [Ulvibacter litoralis]|uniref:RNA polymerase sigma-70 factor, ECF subfamily n=1 Tax=Ulvibacter litoralis TaxID=227084 RepID=A0A1G7J397_9FLAO|nr:hypothetical protein GCM10008083_27120 [Ulvibacter litoralis]SDF19457.1 RNA polymerase sigma-70 factor, ECF subfamily [Ulvibacter litoralis]
MNLNTNYQNILFPYAYNILGSVDDAMDAIQDVITKYISSSKPNIENEISYLIKGIINQSINIKKPLWIKYDFQNLLQRKKLPQT